MDVEPKKPSKFAPKRSAAQKEADYQLIAACYLKGETQAAIAERLTVSRQQVAADLKKIQGRWREACIKDFDERKGEELAKIDHLEATYWDGWERSKSDAVRSTTKRKSEPKATKDRPDAVVVSDEAGIVREAQVGDPRFLAGVENCIDKRCKIFGLYAPTKLDINDLDSLLARELARVSGVTPTEFEQVEAPRIG